MSITSSTLLSDRSRLVGLLSDLSSSKMSLGDHNLAERLGYLIGLSGSLSLARTLRQLPQELSNSAVVDARVLQADVLTTRERMMRAVTHSFVHEADDATNASKTASKTKVPSACIGARAENLQTFEPYQRFYTTHQLEIAVGVKSLRARVRKGMSSVSSDLHQLAELDRTLEENLAVHNRKLFSVPLKILEQRFKQLLNTHRQTMASDVVAQSNDDFRSWLTSDGWLELFYQDMRELMLAELDVRLQPVLGLLEALNEHT